MKTLIFGLLVLGFTSLGLSQDKNDGVSVVQLDELTVSIMNTNYLRTVQDESTPGTIKQIQLAAANFDIKSNPRYDKNAEKPLEVVFESNKGEIVAFYDKNGKIVSSRENFKNIPLPLTLRERFIVDNSGWEMNSNQYLCSYANNKRVKRILKVGLTDGVHFKKLKFNF